MYSDRPRILCGTNVKGLRGLRCLPAGTPRMKGRGAMGPGVALGGVSTGRTPGLPPTFPKPP